MTRSSALRLVPMIVLALALAGCDSIPFFGGDSDDPEDRIGGDRISVLELEQNLTADAPAGEPPPLPPAVATTLWPQSGGFPDQRIGHPAWEGEGETAWRSGIGAGSDSIRRLVARPIAVDGVVFALNAEAEVVAVDLATGGRRWKVGVAPEDEFRETLGGGLAFAEGLLFVTAGFGEVLALDPLNGGLVWSAPTGAPAHAPPTAGGGRVYVVTLDNELIAFDGATGDPLWRHSGLPEAEGLLGAAAPALDSELVVAAFSSGEVVALRAGTGRPAWSDNLSAVRRAGSRWNIGDIRAAPVIDGSVIFAVAASTRLVAIDRRTGARIWQRDLGAFDAPVVAGGWLFVLTAQSELLGLEKATGRIRWIASLPQYEDPEDREDPIRWTGPVLAGGVLAVVSTEEEMRLFDPLTGEERRRIDLPDPVRIAPIVVEGRMIVLSEDGELQAWR